MTSSPEHWQLDGAEQDAEEWDRGVRLPWGRSFSDEDVSRAANTMRVTLTETPFPGSLRCAPRPELSMGACIVLLHGSNGGECGHSRMAALTWASRGFDTLAYSYFGSPGTPAALARIDVATVVDAAAWLREQSATGMAPVILLGGSRGAELALLIASRPELSHTFDAVIAHSPQDATVGSLEVHRDGTVTGVYDDDGRDVPAWVIRGVPVQNGHIIEAHRFDGPIFISQGTDDEVWSPDGVARLERRLADRGHDTHVVWLEGEGHRASWPQAQWLHDEQERFIRAKVLNGDAH